MQKQILISVSILLLILNAKAQITQNSNASIKDISFFVVVNNPKYSDVEGTKYIFEEFVPSKINNLDKTYPVRFDAVDNIMEFKENDQEIKGVTPSREYRVLFSDGSNRIFMSKTIINESGDLQRLFLEEIVTNQSYSLYKRVRINYVPAKPAKSSYEPEVPAIFKKLSDSYYVDYVNDDIDYLLQIPKTKKKIRTFFGDLGSEILKFAKKEGLKFDSQENLIKILDYAIQNQ
ncbi:MAG: hypothetical protein AAGA43_12880 [Bacteroidota bacterium]